MNPRMQSRARSCHSQKESINSCTFQSVFHSFNLCSKVVEFLVAYHIFYIQHNSETVAPDQVIVGSVLF